MTGALLERGASVAAEGREPGRPTLLSSSVSSTAERGLLYHAQLIWFMYRNELAHGQVQPEVVEFAPYIPPLASYRVQGRIGQIRHGVPLVFPEDFGGFEQ
jgi:hypothetical protein